MSQWVVSWLECFAKWDTHNQMIFSVIMVVAFLMVTVLFGLWTLHAGRGFLNTLIVWRSGKPIEEPTPPLVVKAQPILEARKKPSPVRADPIEAWQQQEEYAWCGTKPEYHQSRTLPLSGDGADYHEEARRLKEEQQFEMEAQAKLQEEMTQAQAALDAAHEVNGKRKP